MTKISASESPTSDVIVIGLAKIEGKGGVTTAVRPVSSNFKLDENLLMKTLAELGATGAKNEVLKIPASTKNYSW